MAKKEVVVQNQQTDLASLENEMMGYEGAGVSTSVDDNLVPMMKLLQDNSPEVKKRDSQYIEGAEAGSVVVPILDMLWGPDELIEVQPCHFVKKYVEWVSRSKGGGFVAAYEEMPDDVSEVEITTDSGDTRTVLRRDNGNDIIETRYHTVRVKHNDVWYPVVIPFSSTGHTVSRGWTTLMMNQMIKGRIAPSFFRTYFLGRKVRSKNDNSWYIYEVRNGEWIMDKDVREAGKMLHDAMTVGDKDIAHDQETSTGDDETPF